MESRFGIGNKISLGSSLEPNHRLLRAVPLMQFERGGSWLEGNFLIQAVAVATDIREEFAPSDLVSAQGKEKSLERACMIACLSGDIVFRCLVAPYDGSIDSKYDSFTYVSRP